MLCTAYKDLVDGGQVQDWPDLKGLRPRRIGLFQAPSHTGQF
jgi:hypothetical protein